MDQLYFVVHTHWDREWYQPFQQMRARLVAMADRMIPLVERGTIPSFHFDGQTIVLDDYLEMRPRAEPRLRSLIRAGKIQVGPWYVLADSFLVSGESLDSQSRNRDGDRAALRAPARRRLPARSVRAHRADAADSRGLRLHDRGVVARSRRRGESQSLQLGSSRRQFGADGLSAQWLFQRGESAARNG